MVMTSATPKLGEVDVSDEDNQGKILGLVFNAEGQVVAEFPR